MPKRKNLLFSARLHKSEKADDMMEKLKAHQKMGELGVQASKETEYTMGQVRVAPQVSFQDIHPIILTDTKTTTDEITDVLFEDTATEALGITEKHITEEDNVTLNLRTSPTDEQSPVAQVIIKPGPQTQYEIEFLEDVDSDKINELQMTLAKIILVSEMVNHLQDKPVIYWGDIDLNKVFQNIETPYQKMLNELKFFREAKSKPSL